MDPPLPLPDFSASLFSLGRLPGLLETQGAVLLRRLLPADQLARWLPVFEAAYARADELYVTGQLDAKTYQNFYLYGHADPRDIADYRGWLELLLKQQALRNVLRTLFGPKAWMIFNNTVPRRQSCRNPEHAIGFHQDQEFVGPVQKAVNVWIPFTSAGGDDYPGLELWLGAPQTAMLNFAMSPDEREAVCAQIPPEALWRPCLEPGDVLLFTPYTLHRTWLAPGMSRTRYSFELRMASEADIATLRSTLVACEL